MEVDDLSADEPLGWSVVANLTREATHVRADGTRATGTRHFAPGAKLWVLPAQWGDGWDQVLAVGTFRGTRGRQLCRIIISSDLLVNGRAKPIYSKELWDEFSKPWSQDTDTHTWPSQEEAVRAARGWAYRAYDSHVGVGTFLDCRARVVHWADQICDFCTGFHAQQSSVPRDLNPKESGMRVARTPGGRAYPSAHEVWDLGWYTSACISTRTTSIPPVWGASWLYDQALSVASRRGEAARACAYQVPGMTTDLARTLLRHAGLRVRVLAGDDDDRHLIGRLTVRESDGKIIAARAG